MHNFDSFNDWGGRGCRKFVPVLGGNGTKIAPPGEMFDQPPGEMRWIRGKLADHVEDHAVLSPEGAVSMTTPGTESSYLRPPQSLNDFIHIGNTGDITFLCSLFLLPDCLPVEHTVVV